ncbi:DUF4234 domain-containing protein [uncultured Bifidobacterium sp.]|uniref:DUF4234 domain-containing protein n=1 Tax=uncultured Bifidobacterium sp. TaxID=165187 RepID=UPI00260D38C4|nr:DUF4234 domain-containing protein [uncultured Bifidobacterium sp.]
MNSQQFQVRGTETSLPPIQSPVGRRKTNRSLAKFVLLGFITLGIYDIVVMTESTNTLNLIANRYDGKKTMHYCLMVFLVGWITAGIGWLVWCHRISNRIGDELQRRGHARKLSASDYWLWGVLGSLIVVGPFIYMYKFLHAMNELAEDYNQRG